MERKYKLFWVAYIALILWAICALCSCNVQKRQWRKALAEGKIDISNYQSLVKGQKQIKKMNKAARKFWRQK